MSTTEQPAIALAAVAPPPRMSRSAVAGLILAFLFWPAGLLVSMVAMARTSPRRGAAAKQGRGLAIGGLVCSLALCALFVTVAAVIVALDDTAPVDDDAQPASAAAPAAAAPAAAASAAEEPVDVAAPSPAAAPEPDQAQQLQAAIDLTGGWGHWSDTVVGLEDNGMMVTMSTSLYDKPSNEDAATRLCAFTLATAYGQVDGPLALRVAASDGVSLAKCELPD